MSGQGKADRLTGLLLLSVLGLSISFQHAHAQSQTHKRHWKSFDELLIDGQISSPEPILEVTLFYDANASPQLQIVRAHIKRGYAPMLESQDEGYVLSQHNDAGVVLSALIFEIPNEVLDPPPRGGWQRSKVRRKKLQRNMM